MLSTQLAYFVVIISFACLQMISAQSMLSICLSRNGDISSLLEGEYVDTGSHEDSFGSLEFVSTNNAVTMYMWFYDNHWVLSPYDLDEALNTTDVTVYGQCLTTRYHTLPSCLECWQFFWSLTPLSSLSNSPFIEDCVFSLSADLEVCAVDTDPYTGAIDYVESICLTDIDVSSLDSHVAFDADTFLGEYQLTDDAMFYQNTDKFAFLYHESLVNQWRFVSEEDLLPKLLCHDKNVEWIGDSDTDGMISIPQECFAWDDVNNMSVAVETTLSLAQNCGDGEMKSNRAIVVVTVVLVLVFLGFLIGFCVWKRRSQGQVQFFRKKAEKGNARSNNIGMTEMASNDEDQGGPADVVLPASEKKGDVRLGLTAPAHTVQQSFDMDELNDRDESIIDPLS